MYFLFIRIHGAQGFEEELKWWDMAFWAERLREARCAGWAERGGVVCVCGGGGGTAASLGMPNSGRGRAGGEWGEYGRRGLAHFD